MTSAERELLMSIGSGLLALLQRDTDAGSMAAATRIAAALQGAVTEQMRGHGLVETGIEHRGTVR